MKKLMPILLVYFVCCSKDNDQNTSNLDLITSGKWIPESIIYNPPIDFLGNGVIVADVYTLYEPCEKDNTLEFILPSILKFDEGATKCSPSDPQNESGTWKLINNDTQLEIYDNVITDTFSIIGKKLVLVFEEPDFDGTNGGKDYIITATLKQK